MFFRQLGTPYVALKRQKRGHSSQVLPGGQSCASNGNTAAVHRGDAESPLRNGTLFDQSPVRSRRLIAGHPSLGWRVKPPTCSWKFTVSAKGRGNGCIAFPVGAPSSLGLRGSPTTASTSSAGPRRSPAVAHSRGRPTTSRKGPTSTLRLASNRSPSVRVGGGRAPVGVHLARLEVPGTKACQ